VEHNYIIPFIM